MRSRSIVYFGYLGDEDADGAMVRRRIAFMDQQLQWLSGLIATSGERVDVLVPYVAPRAYDAEVHHAITRHGFRVDPASVQAERRNRFEYTGFRAMKTLAESSAPDDLIYYCHSKGIMQLSQGKMGLFRLHTEVGLLSDLAGFETEPTLTRACLFPSKFGWCFYNFFWVKAGYMAGRTVAESADRYHFETVMGDPCDREGYRGVLPLIDRLPPEDCDIAVKPWYRASETSSPALFATYDRYAGMRSPSDSARNAIAEQRARRPECSSPPTACQSGPSAAEARSA